MSNIRSGPGSDISAPSSFSQKAQFVKLTEKGKPVKAKIDKNFKPSENENYDSEEAPYDNTENGGSGTLRTFAESCKFKDM